LLTDAPLDAVPNRQERTLAALAHASILLYVLRFSFIPGLVVAVAIWWWSRRDGSGWFNWQAKQAVVYQLMVMVVIVSLMYFANTVLVPHTFAGRMPGGQVQMDPSWKSYVGPGLAPGMYGAALGAWLATLGIFAIRMATFILIAGGAFAANSAYRGNDTRYPVIGDRLRQPDVVS
jgi:uncharacterized membrane protein